MGNLITLIQTRNFKIEQQSLLVSGSQRRKRLKKSINNKNVWGWGIVGWGYGNARGREGVESDTWEENWHIGTC